MTAKAPLPVPVPPSDMPQQSSPAYPPMQTVPYQQHYPPSAQVYHPPPPGYPGYPTSSLSDPRLPPRLAVTQPQGAPTLKRPPSQTFAGDTPPKKKQSKWTADEDREIIDLRGRGLKWEDISKRLPGRSAISCRLRFQNYLERRSEWDEEKKNKLARLYERFKKDMWEKIAKEMQLPWRAAEAMHWQIGEVEMAQRANVQVFTLAGQQGAGPSQAGAGSEGGNTSTSPSSATTALPPSSTAYSHSHNHSLPHVPQHALGHPISPVEHFRRNSIGAMSPGEGGLRRRADSTRSVASAYPRGNLPPLEEVRSPIGQDREQRSKYPPSW